MKICADKHDEICFEGRNCPFCDYITDMELQLKEAGEEIQKLEEALKEKE
jgi:hypothetical protein